MNPGTLGNCLARLAPHVDATRIALTGGVAIGLHLDLVCGDRTRATAAEDVDFVAGDVDAVYPTVTNEFLVSHFHLPQPGYQKFLIQLVDPVTQLRLDFFPDALRALSRAPVVDVAGASLRVLDARDILDHKIALLSKASAASPIEEKHYEDAKRLAAICGRSVPALSPSHIGTAGRSQNLEEICDRCQVSRHAGFPLAPKRAIFDVLGYV